MYWIWKTQSARDTIVIIDLERKLKKTRKTKSVRDNVTI